MYRIHPKAWLVLIGDLVILYLALGLALAVRRGTSPDYEFFLANAVPFSALFLIWLGVYFSAGLYNGFLVGYRVALAKVLLTAQFVNWLSAVLFFYLITFLSISPRANLVLTLLFSTALLFFWRLLIAPFIITTAPTERLFLIGPSREIGELAEALRLNPYYSAFRVAGMKPLEDIPPAASWEQILPQEIAAGGGSLALVVFFGPQFHGRFISHLYKMSFGGARVFDFRMFYENLFHKIPISLTDEAWFLANISSRTKLAYDAFKRILDIAGAFFGSFLFLAALPFAALAIKIDDGGPIFSVQPRVGQGRRIFRLVKFRSMRVGAEARWPEKEDKRITRCGRWLRRSRIDELPQLWNVFAGDMSLVGPRPDLLDFAGPLEEAIPYYSVRTLVKPGITGWAQVTQRVAGLNPSSVKETEERLAYDIYYMKNRSLFLDFIIILKTARAVFSRPGA